jgi:flagellar protein FliO/FliZ
MTKLTLPSRAAATAAAALCACLLACAFAACPAAAFTSTSKAAGGENAPLNLSGGGSSASTPHTSTGGASLVRTIVGLAIVIAVIWGLTWIMRQVKANRDPQVTSAGLASVAALSLSSGRSLHLVRAGSDYVLLGSAEHGVVPIHRYTEEEAREAGLLAGDVVPTPQRARVLSRGRGTATPQLTTGSAGQVRRNAGQAGSGGGAAADPMGTPAPGSGVVARLREWTVRR